MIITVTLNAAIDKALSVPNFRIGRRHRTVEQRTTAGGKGVNIARTLKALGQPVIATGFAGGATGTHLVEQLTEESILNDFVRIRDETRTNTSVQDPTTGEQTEVNERGPLVSDQEIELFRDKLLYLARGAAIVVFAGSLPRGVEPDIYASLIRDLQRLDVITVVDTDGEPLRQAARAEPDVVSPNVIEAEELVGHEFAGEEERLQAVAEIAALGPREAIMTLPDGCIAQVLVDGQRLLKRARIEPREPIAKRGSGDAFLAGYLAARYEGRAPDQCLRFGVACGAESTGRMGAGLIDPREGAPPDGRRRADGHRGTGPCEPGALAARDVAAQEDQVRGRQARDRVQGADPRGMADRRPVRRGAQKTVPVGVLVGQQVRLDAFEPRDLRHDREDQGDADGSRRPPRRCCVSPSRAARRCTTPSTAGSGSMRWRRTPAAAPWAPRRRCRSSW